MKFWNTVDKYIFLPYQLRLERVCSTLTWFLCSSKMPLAPLSGLPLWFPWRECAHFLLGSLNMPCSTRCLGHIVTLLPSLLRFYSVILLLSSDATGCQGKIFRDPRINVEIQGVFHLPKDSGKFRKLRGEMFIGVLHSRPIHFQTPFTVRCIFRQNTKWRHNFCCEVYMK